MYAVEIENTANKSVSAQIEREYERAPHTQNITSNCVKVKNHDRSIVINS